MEVNSANLPHHIAIIMDGNGRWAKQHAMGRIRGHKRGAKAVRETVTACREIGISFLTLYAFSSENWGRPQNEINALMDLLEEYLDSQVEELVKQGIILTTIGDIERLPLKVRDKLERVKNTTRNNSKMVLNLALSYGSRDEIISAVRKIAEDRHSGIIAPQDITKERFSAYLHTQNLPDPDLLIRTSGEYRISNFLLWQMAYTEMYFSDVLWPDFDKEELYKAIAAYQRRERRFGLTSEQMESDAVDKA